MGSPGLEISSCISISASTPCVSGMLSNSISLFFRRQSPGCSKRSEMNKPSPTLREVGALEPSLLALKSGAKVLDSAYITTTFAGQASWGI